MFQAGSPLESVFPPSGAANASTMTLRSNRELVLWQRLYRVNSLALANSSKHAASVNLTVWDEPCHK